MTSLADRPNTALLVIDVQRGVVANAFETDRVVANINSLVLRARSEQVPVIWIQHSDDGLPFGSDEWQYVEQLTMEPGEPVVHKHFGDSFEGTELEELLAQRQVGRLIVTGAQTDACIRSTLHGGLVRGYDTVLVEDAHTTEDMRQWGSPISPEQSIGYTNLYWQFSAAPGRSGGTATTAGVDFSRAK